MKTFKQMYDEMMAESPTMTAADAGIPHDTKDMGPTKRKRKYKILTRRFVEIMGKRKRQVQ